MSNDVFYFIAQVPNATPTTLTVIDLSYSCSYERDEFRTINQRDYTEAQDAIADARKIAAQQGWVYQPFSSRYDSNTDEQLDVNTISREQALSEIRDALPDLSYPMVRKYSIQITGGLTLLAKDNDLIEKMMDCLANEDSAYIARYYRLIVGHGVTID